MNAEALRDAVRALVGYCWSDELDDYLDHQGEAGHVFLTLVALDNWADGGDKTADDYARAARRRRHAC